MSKRFASLTSTFVLGLGLAAFTGSALAGNGNGNGNGNNKAAAPTAPAASAPASQTSSPGNSANAPGQVKKGQVTAGAKGGGSADQNVGPQAGVKPTNATAKGTTCGPVGGSSSSATCAPTGTAATNAQSAGKADASKRYGNGRTAAQIAVQNGASGATLYGPGNSQPHKAACPGSTKGVDVHALKAKGQQKKCGVSASQPTAQSKPNVTAKVTGPPANVPGAAVSSGAAVSGGVQGAAAGGAAAGGAGPTAQGNSPQGGVLGVTASESQSAGGVLGAIEAVGQGTLPFTGFPLWVAVAAAMAMLLLGLALRRYGRVTV